MKDSDKRKFIKFKQNLEKIKTDLVVVETEYVLMNRGLWDYNKEQYDKSQELRKVIYNK